MTKNRTRSHRLEVYLNMEEWERLEELTDKSGRSRSDVIRAMLMGYRLKEKPGADLGDFQQQLLRIGNNMNQIAAAANARGLLDAPYYRQQAEQLQTLRLWILEALQLPERIPEPDEQESAAQWP